MAKYLDPKANETFKKALGEHRNLVISLLNALLPLDDGKQIDVLQLVFIELPKFKPQSFAEKRMAVLWLKFLTEIDDFNDAIEELAKEKKNRDETVARADAAVEKLRQSACKMKNKGFAVADRRSHRPHRRRNCRALTPISNRKAANERNRAIKQ